MCRRTGLLLGLESNVLVVQVANGLLLRLLVVNGVCTGYYGQRMISLTATQRPGLVPGERDTHLPVLKAS